MRILLFILISFSSIFIISSCSKKGAGTTMNNTDTTTNKHDSTITVDTSIIGKWEVDSFAVSITFSPFPPVYRDSVFTHGHSLIQIYNADSTLLQIDETQTPADTTTGTYYLANDSIYFRQTGDVNYIPEGRYAISNNYLNIMDSEDSSGAVLNGTLYLTRQ
jgi:hypothetical protein